jgi:heat shock protein HslJ
VKFLRVDFRSFGGKIRILFKYEVFMKKKLCFFAVPLIFSAFFVSCATSKAEPEGDWQLISFEKDGVARTICDSSLSVSKTDDSVYSVEGFSGVNDFSVKISAKGNSISSSSLASTKMAGGKEAMEFENLYFASISSADSWAVSEKDRTLEIKSSAENSTARFFARTLPMTSWKITGINMGDGMVLMDSEITLAFSSDSAANGYTGVNVLNISYEADSSLHTISFGDGQLTMKAGTVLEMKAESYFLENLKNAKKYSLLGKNLTIFDENGEALLEFSAD